ncbi:MAG: hypothetical protein IJV19_05940 [Prevotella sp.]|nr:hypothetical protein [Prevotella sp.]
MDIIKQYNIVKGALIGNLMKVRVWFDIHVRKSISISDKQDDSFIVSLTSYGHRVQCSVVYTIYSMIKQRLRPERIVLWLSQDEFSIDTLPASLLFLRRYGLDIRFCEDIRSYKKLIPAREMFGDKNIITIDDDIYYSPLLTQELVSQHRENPDCIIAECALITEKKDDGFKPYVQWNRYHRVSADFVYDPLRICPIGFGGVLYPAGIFSEEVLHREVFMTLCPQADDIWFFYQALRSGIKRRFVVDSRVNYYPVDLFRQKRQRDRLCETNAGESLNDSQLKALVAHYGIK